MKKNMINFIFTVFGFVVGNLISHSPLHFAFNPFVVIGSFMIFVGGFGFGREYERKYGQK